MPTSIPARQGAHCFLQPSQKLKLTTPSGLQVVDLWAFPLAGPPSWMAMGQTRSKLMKLTLSPGDVLVNTRREPLLKLVEDSSSGTHDMLFPPCDQWRYAQAGVPEHGSCGDNLRRELTECIASEQHPTTESLQELEATISNWGWTPEPLNVFMNVPWSPDGSLQVQRPDCKAHDFVVLEALTACLIVMSACPNDLMDTNGRTCGPVQYEVIQ